MILGTNTSKLTFRELMNGNSILAAPIIFIAFWGTKLLRVSLPGSCDIPPVVHLDEYFVSQEEMDADIRQALVSIDQQLRDLGYRYCTATYVNDRFRNTRYGSSLYLAPDSKSVLWVRTRRQPTLAKKFQYNRMQFMTVTNRGQLISTTSSARDANDPSEWNVQYFPRVKLQKLAEQHQQHIASRSNATELPRVIAGEDDAVDILTAMHGRWSSYQQERGFLANPASAVVSGSNDTTTISSASTDPIVMAVRQMETKKTQWIAKLALLVVSIAVFVWIGLFQFTKEWLLLLLPILFVHEMGHWIAMKIFGYKDVKMFFIPFFGAAVSGRHYSVAGWKKAVVSLAGPIPSIAIGIVVAIVAMVTRSELAERLALMTLIINGFNLLPFLPLDGGWVAHATLFTRSRYLDIAYRVFTIGMLFLATIALQARGLFIVAISMAMGLPASWRTMVVVDSLRQQEVPKDDSDQIPEAAIHLISKALQEAKLPIVLPHQLAASTVQVYEQVSSKPPSAAASVALLFTQFAAIAAVIVFSIAITGVKMIRSITDVKNESVHVPIDLTQPRMKVGNGALPQKDLLYWEFQDQQQADGAFEQIKSQGGSSVAQFGKIVLKSSPGQDDESKLDDAIEFDSIVKFPQTVEKLASEDPRLREFIFQSSQSRRFGGELVGMPQIQITFQDIESAKQVSEQINHMPPELPGDVLAIPAWYPGNGLSEEQRALRRVFAIVNERSLPSPWENPIRDADRDASNLAAEESPSAWGKNVIERFERKKAWIQREIEVASGKTKELLEAYQEYEESLQEYRTHLEELFRRNPKAGIAEYPKLPDVNQILLRFKETMGYLDPKDTNYRIASNAGVHFGRSFGIDDLFEDGTLPNESISPTGNQDIERTLVISIYAAPDPAVAIGGLVAWLKKKQPEEISIVYSRLIKPRP